MRGINSIIEAVGTVYNVTKAVNGGTSALAERTSYYNKFYNILGG